MSRVMLVNFLKILFDGLGLNVFSSASVSAHCVHDISTDNHVNPIWIRCEIISYIVIV